MNSVRDLLLKTINEEKQARACSFLSPYTEQSKFAIIKIQGVNYKFNISGFNGSGFGIFKPTSPTSAIFVEAARFEQIYDYLQLLPQIHMILVCQTNIGWSAYPFNLESSIRRFGIDCEVIVRNISDVERFDTVSVRFDGRNFWYEEPFSGGDPVKSLGMRSVFCEIKENVSKKIRETIKGVTPEEEKAFELAIASWIIFKKQTTQDKVKELLACGGAKLDNYIIRGDQIEITWQAKSGSYYRSRVDKTTLDVTSAGICLSGEDSKFHIKDLPGIIQEGEERHAIYVTDRIVEPRNLDLE